MKACLKVLWAYHWKMSMSIWLNNFFWYGIPVLYEIDKITDSQLKEFLKKCQEKYIKAKIEPGKKQWNTYNVCEIPVLIGFLCKMQKKRHNRWRIGCTEYWWTRYADDTQDISLCGRCIYERDAGCATHKRNYKCVQSNIDSDNNCRTERIKWLGQCAQSKRPYWKNLFGWDFPIYRRSIHAWWLLFTNKIGRRSYKTVKSKASLIIFVSLLFKKSRLKNSSLPWKSFFFWHETCLNKNF